MPALSPTARLGEWISTRPDDWSAASTAVAADAYTDTLACIFAGRGEPVVQKLDQMSVVWGDGPAAAVGARRRVPAPTAALINGTAAHALDYDDILDPSMSHPSATLVPALLALADLDETAASGEKLIDAWLVGLDVLAALGEAFNLTHYFRGWHSTLSLGAPATAAACARFLRLDAASTSNVIALATSMAGGSKRQFGSMAKPVHAGLAAQNGLVAALMARNGIDAAPEIFEGRWGMLEMTAPAGNDHPAPAGFARLEDSLAAVPAAERYGIWAKSWPSCGSTHRMIAAALQLRDEGGWTLDQIEEIEILASPTALGNLPFIFPKTAAEAKFCLPYCVGHSLIDGKLGLSAFDASEITRPDIAALSAKTRIREDPDLVGQALDSALFERGTVILHLSDGTSVAASCTAPPGHPSNPLSPEALAEKFHDCSVYGGLSPTWSSERLEAVQTLAQNGRNPISAL